MNFKKYHVSRNLWSFHPNTTLVQVTLTWDGEKIVFSGTCSSAANVASSNFTLPKGTYTLKANANRIPVDRSTVCIDLYRASPFFQKKIENDVSVDGSVTFTIEDDMELAMRIRLETGVNYDGFTLKPMLNSGESSQTYEPYSSEVWHDTPHYIHNTSTDTITTLPADIYANDTTATVGLKGNMSQSGTPTPTTPIQPSECGERTGNLLDRSTEQTGYFVKSDGTLQGSSPTWIASDYVEIEENTEYTFTPNSTAGNAAKHCFYNENKQPFVSAVIDSGQQTFTTPTGAKYARFSYRTSSSNVMLNTGSTALPYEPYGYKIPILSAGTTTPVYLGEVQTTRKIKKLVFDGTESFVKNRPTDDSDYLYNYIPTEAVGYIGDTTDVCSHLPYNNNPPIGATIGTSISSGKSTIYLNFGADIMNAQASGNTLAGLKEYLASEYAAGRPVTVWYVLRYPKTDVVNEPLRKIGDYADTLSNVSIPVTAGANTLSVDTTLQPSEVTVNYKGWHPVADVHERDSGQWD